MEIFITIISIIVGAGVLVFLIEEDSHKYVYGSLLKEDFLDQFFDSRIDTYELNQLTSYIMKEKANFRAPYIAIAKSFLSKWHINRVGCIPRWSKWSKRLDEKREELLCK